MPSGPPVLTDLEKAVLRGFRHVWANKADRKAKSGERDVMDDGKTYKVRCFIKEDLRQVIVTVEPRGRTRAGGG